MHVLKTSALRLAYEESGPREGERLLLLHGWPDSPRTWDKVLPALHGAGYRTVAPYIRGYGASRFREPFFGRNPRRTGQAVAYAQDVLELADGLGMQRFHFIGHDWGARAGYAIAATARERLKSLVAISVPFEPGPAKPPAFPQARAFWYQWLLCSKPGEALFREDPVAFGRAQWDAWSPAGWYSEREFQETAKSWRGEDFKDVVLHAYRSRWGHAEPDPKYAAQQKVLEAAKTLDLPTLLIHGRQDACELKETTDGAERCFTGGYARMLVDGAGHFPQREASETTARAIVGHLARNAS